MSVPTSYQFRENGVHYNGGAEFFGYGYVAIGEPRLTMVRKWFRKGEKRGTCVDEYSVDGSPIPGHRIREALARPPEFSADEVAALRVIGDEPADYRTAIAWELRHSLGAKGAIAWGPPGRCARTDLGRAVAKGESP